MTRSIAASIRRFSIEGRPSKLEDRFAADQDIGVNMLRRHGDIQFMVIK
jgi:hypothetical protein